MPATEPQLSRDASGVEVLTLAEVAAYLRVSEEAVRELIETQALPARRIGDEWRFLKRAVAKWLRLGPHDPRRGTFPATEGRAAPPGSKEAVLRYFGVFKDDADLEEQLATIRAQRGAVSE